jgi:predicted AAA+ superfamily ATPase
MVGCYLDLLEAARVLRRWQPMRINLSKRLLKTPKTYRHHRCSGVIGVMCMAL